jgi:hypothetical protein
MDARHADVGHASGAVAERGQRHRGLLGDREVARSGGHDRHAACAGRRAVRARTICCACDAVDVDLVERRLQSIGGVGRDSRHEHGVAAFGNPRCDLANLLGALTRAVDHLGKSLAQRAMMIDRREAERVGRLHRLQRLERERVQRLRHAERSVRDLVQHVADALPPHTSRASSGSPSAPWSSSAA